MKKEIKNLLIDFGGVLIDLDRKRCIENFKRLGLHDIGNMLNDFHQQGFFLDYEKGLINSAEFRDKIRALIGKPVTDEEIDHAWNSFLRTVPSYKLRLLLRLKRHYKIFLLSNTNDIHWQYSLDNVFACDGHNVHSYFNRLFLSYKMHLAKPDPAIFTKLLEKTGINPEETLFIDDSAENCRAAETLGIRTYTPAAQEDWGHLFPEVAVRRAATIGFFDGMHEGHRYIMSTVITLAKGLKYDSAVVTFPVHPRKVLQADYQPQLLTTTEERYEMIRESGIDHCISLEFTPELAALSARDFMKKLRDEYRVDALVVGYDHRFGRNRSDNLQDYMQYGFELKMVVFPIEPYINDKFKQVIVSSSLIRQIALKGDVRTASRYLTYHYFLQGTVTSGYQVGRTLGFPTANVKVDNPDKIIPADGVYAVEVVIEGQTYRGMLYIGTRPTLHNGPERSIEVNIFDFDQDIYNSPIRLIFIDYVRKDLKFDSVEELTAQLHRDREAVLKMF